MLTEHFVFGLQIDYFIDAALCYQLMEWAARVKLGWCNIETNIECFQHWFEVKMLVKYSSVSCLQLMAKLRFINDDCTAIKYKL